jgi:hypothetical protein
MSALAGPLLACAGHVLVDLPIFMGPVVVLAGWLLMMTHRARRQERLETDVSERAGEHEIGDNLFAVHA